jgi:hypothetical protein
MAKASGKFGVMTMNQKQCPNCRRWISLMATACPFCTRDQPEESTGEAVIMMAVCAVIAVIVVWFVF